MAIWDLLKQAPLAAIGRAVQGYFQPKQQQATPTTSTQGFTSGFVGGSVGGGGGGGGGGSLVKNAQGQLVPAPSSGGGGGGSSGGGGGSGEQPPYAPNVVNQTVSYGGRTWKGNPGSGWTLEESRPQAQAPAAPAAPPRFDMGAFSRKMQDMASSASQKFSAGLGAAGEAVKAGGSNLMSAIGRSVQPMPNFKVGAMDENAPVTKKPASFTNPVQGTWNLLGRNLPDIGLTEKLFGGKGSMEPTTLYNPKAAQVGQIGEKMGMEPSPLPTTPPALGGGGGAGSVLGLSDVTFASLVDEIMSPSSFAQAAQMPMEDLDAAYTQMASELGVTKQQAVLNDLNTQVLEVTDSLESIDKDVTAEAGDVLMTEGQRRRLVEARSRPLREQLVKLMRSAQYAGVGLDNLMGMLKDRMSAKQQTVTNQFQASQQAQSAEEKRKRRLLGLLPYVQPKAKAVSSGGGGGEFDLESLLG